MNKTFIIVLILTSVAVVLYLLNISPTPYSNLHPYQTTGGSFLTINGTTFSYKGRQVYLRGENFNNGHAMNFNDPNSPPSNMLAINENESDYALLANYGANHVRFGLAYSWYAKNRTQFFQTLDQHIAWAKKHRLWMIPVLFTLPNDCWEGYSSTCAAYWSASTGQQVLVKNFWVDIAARYRNETAIAGYDILNEPTPTYHSVWYGVAQALHDAILQADPNHFVVIEATGGNGTNPSFSKTFGSKTVYSEHDYLPDSLTQFLFSNQSPPITGVNPYKYPGSAPDWQNQLHYWSKYALAGNTNDLTTNMSNYLSLAWFKTNNVPLWMGEMGTLANYVGYNQLLQDKLILYNSYGVHWAHFDWKEGPGNFSLYPVTGPLVLSDKPMLNAVLPEWQGSIQPD